MRLSANVKLSVHNPAKEVRNDNLSFERHPHRAAVRPADCLYAVVGAFGLTIVSDFLSQYQTIISILGSGLILFMGIRLILKKEEVALTQTNTIGGVKMFLSSFAIGITNPAAILTFLFAFTYFVWHGLISENRNLRGT